MDNNNIDNLENEIAILKKLTDNPFIMKYYDAFKIDQKYFIVSEIYKENLAIALKNKKRSFNEEITK